MGMVEDRRQRQLVQPRTLHTLDRLLVHHSENFNKLSIIQSYTVVLFLVVFDFINTSVIISKEHYVELQCGQERKTTFSKYGLNSIGSTKFPFTSNQLVPRSGT